MMKKTTNPAIFPRPDVYVRAAIHLDLDCMTDNAAIYYTLDGSDPTFESACYRREEGLITAPLVPAAPDQPVQATVIVKAFAAAPGLAPSDTVSFRYEFRRRPQTEYLDELLRPRTPEAAGLIRISGYDEEKMYLIVGTERAVLVDAGMDREGDLPGLVRSLIGELPCDVVLTHGHIDHYGQAWKLKDAGFRVYMDKADVAVAKDLFGDDLSFTEALPEDACFDLGNTVLRCYRIAGHTAAGTVLVDEKTGDAFSGDALGSNGNAAPDALLLHLGNPEGALDRMFPTLVQFMRKAGNKVRHLYTGHNDSAVEARVYLPMFVDMVQQAVDQGDAARKPALRPLSDGLTSSPDIIACGNHRTGQDWAAANVGKDLFSKGLTADNLSLLADLYAARGDLEPPFAPRVQEYCWYPGGTGDKLVLQPMSTRCRRIAVDGSEVGAGQPFVPSLCSEIEITAPDGMTKTIYRIRRVDA